MTSILSSGFRVVLACALTGAVAVASAQTGSSMAASGAMSSDMAASGTKTTHKTMKKMSPGTHESTDMNTARSTATPASMPMGKGTMATPSAMAASGPRK